MVNPESLPGRVTLFCGDAREQILAIPDNSIDSVCTDPPYALVSITKRFGKDGSAPPKSDGATGIYKRAAAGFMNKVWDTGETAFAVEFWEQVLRVLKPGGHLVAFGGTRTYHRLACAIEDAGFESRDTVIYLYGSGFPKSHNISKAIDKSAGVDRKITRERYTVKRIKPGATVVKEGAWGKQEISYTATDTEPSTPEAAEWDGWGTALKPSCELIMLARKPLSEGTIARNILKWGCGGLNIDGCRIPSDGEKFARPVAFGNELHEGWRRPWQEDPIALAAFEDRKQDAIQKAETLGRWPANTITDGSEEVVAGFPETTSGNGDRRPNGGGEFFKGIAAQQADFTGDSGSAARFFYTAKADADDRIGSKHPTIKPVDLIQYLVRLVTPPNGTVLDCFAGTGTTGEAAFREGFNAVLIEREAEYQVDIRRRMELALAGPDERKRESIKARGLTANAGPLFGFDDEIARGGADKSMGNLQTKVADARNNQPTGGADVSSGNEGILNSNRNGPIPDGEQGEIARATEAVPIGDSGS